MEFLRNLKIYILFKEYHATHSKVFISCFEMIHGFYLDKFHITNFFIYHHLCKLQLLKENLKNSNFMIIYKAKDFF
jgi:hypothetical protein